MLSIEFIGHRCLPVRLVAWLRAGYIPEHVILSATPVIAGTAVVTPRTPHPALLVVLAVAAAVANEIGGRYINYRQDATSSVDAGNASLPSSHPLSRGYPSIDHMYVVGVALLVAFGVMAVIICVSVNVVLFPLGIALTVLTFNYAGGPIRFGHRGLAEAGRFAASFLMGAGTSILLSHKLEWSGFLVGLSFGSLAVAGMTVQNIRDHRADASAGKMTAPARGGPDVGRRLILLATAAAAVSTLVLAVSLRSRLLVFFTPAALLVNAGPPLQSRGGRLAYYAHPTLTVIAFSIITCGIVLASRS